MVSTHNTPGLSAPAARWYSHAAAVGVTEQLLFVSGQMALDGSGHVIGAGDMRTQAEHVFTALDQTLSHHRCSFADVVHIRTYVTDMDQLGAYGDVRARFITGNPPTSTTVEVSRLFAPGALLEVELIAARDVT